MATDNNGFTEHEEINKNSFSDKGFDDQSNVPLLHGAGEIKEERKVEQDKNEATPGLPLCESIIFLFGVCTPLLFASGLKTQMDKMSRTMTKNGHGTLKSERSCSRSAGEAGLL